MEDDRPYVIAFSAFPSIGPIRFSLLCGYFGSARAAFLAPERALRATGLTESLVSAFVAFRSSFVLDRYLADLDRSHTFAVLRSDSSYPPLLSHISDAPLVLYGKGNRHHIPNDGAFPVAVVGTRTMTPYGREITERLVCGLVAAGCTIVSGMAFGVDAVAHTTALDRSGKTVAVLGSGVDIASPAGNARIYDRIVDGGGVVLSEYPLGFVPTKWSFPLRNRVISGLSLGVLVTEGAEDSGSLITARRAADQGRDVFAVPGPVTSPMSRGPAKLLRDGAILVEHADDILEGLGIGKPAAFRGSRHQMLELTKEEAAVVGVLEAEGRAHIDLIVRKSGLPVDAAIAACTVLEVRGIVKNYGGDTFGRST